MSSTITELTNLPMGLDDGWTYRRNCTATSHRIFVFYFIPPDDQATVKDYNAPPAIAWLTCL